MSRKNRIAEQIANPDPDVISELDRPKFVLLAELEQELIVLRSQN